MKKSKFLKKSLAMLLALMLVVAMIPLSAAAADQPSLTSLSIGGQTVRINEDGKTFETTVARHSTELTLAVAQDALNYANGKSGTLEIMKSGESSGTAIPGNLATDKTPMTITLSQYGVDTANNGGTLNLRLLNAEGKVVANYQIVLGIHDPSSTASLEESTPTDGTGTYRVEVNNGAETINLVVAEGALKANNAATTNGTATGAHFRVQTQDNATITAGPNADVTDMKGGWYEIYVTAKEAKITVTSESKTNVSTYTIKSEEVKSLQTFNFGDYEGKWDATHGTITVTIPEEDGKDAMGYNVDFDLPVSFTTYGDTDKVWIDDSANVTTATADEDNAHAYQVGDKLDIGTLIDKTGTNPKYSWTSKIWVDCKGYSKLQEYTLVIKLGEDNDTGIVDAYFNGNQASIDGNEITAVLPMRDENDDNTDLDAVEVVLYTASSANVKSIAGFQKSTDVGLGNSDIAGYDMWVANQNSQYGNARVIDVRDKQVVVTAEDGSTQTYVLSASIEQNTTAANMTSIYITGDGYTSTGSIQGNTIYFEVPYLTTNIGGWKIYATANSAANVISNRTAGNAAVVKNGVATMANLGFGALDPETKLDEQKVPDKDTNNIKHNVISAVNMNDNDYFNDYTVVVNLIDPKTNGTTLEEIEISVQNNNPNDGPFDGKDSNEKVTSRVNSSNSIAARAYDETITELGKDVGNAGTIKLTTPWSLRMPATKGNTWRVLTNIETAEGGVAFYVMKGADDGREWWGGYVLSDLPNNQAPFSGNLIQDYTEDGKVGDWYIVVLPEDVARTVLAKGAAAGNIIFSTETGNEGTVYTIDEDVQDAYTYKTVSNLYVKDANLTVKQSTNVNNETTSVGEVTGALPWSYTVSEAEKDDLNADKNSNAGQFLTFDIQAYATLHFIEGTGYSSNIFYSAGDVDGDGEADAPNTPISSGNRAVNPSLLFVRQDDGTVDLYQWSPDGAGTYQWRAVTDNKLVSVAENGTSTLTYTFRLTWNPANTTADLKSFSINGVNGTFNGNNVSVYLPYGTDLKGLVPTFTTSEYATVHLDSKTGDPVVSGKTSLNFSQTVRLVVVSEDDQKTNPYTVTVTLSDAFSDVPSTAWYYNNVMQAAANGIVNGRGDGTFDPSASVTRRDFAIMLTQMLGISNDGSAVSPFIDVADDDYGVVAIAYCKEHGIISGYEEDGTFRPAATITRQEAASMITKAMGVSEKSSEKYPDDSSIANWAKDAVYMAKAAGLMEGDAGTGNFRPTSTITRAEAASIMVNALEQ